jgi:serine protease Do
MKRVVQYTTGGLAGMALLSLALISGQVSFPASHASSETAQASSTGVQSVAPAAAEGFTAVAKSVTPAVVNITTAAAETVSDAPNFRDRMEEFFGMPGDPFGPRKHRGPKMPREHQRSGMGSGVIVTKDGYILTNNHVVDGAKELTVTLPDKREFKGKVVGADPKTDLAVVKIDGDNLPMIPWGDASKLQVGEYVLAVGNPFGLNSTVTLGIVSALGRGRMGITQYEDFIQTDAAINPGNSGGALVNTKGELVGINTAIFSQTGGYQGVGFAVPTSMSKPVFESLIKHGKVVRGYLGIGIQDLNQDLTKSFGLKDSKGALVSDVKEDSPADKAGIKQGDVIIGYDGSPIEDAAALQRLVMKTPIDAKATIKVLRDGHEKELTAKISELPEPTQVAKAGGEEGDYGLAGLAVQDLDRDTAQELGLKGKVQGVVVTGVEPDSGADRAGLMPGDVIREINRKPVKSVQDYEKAASSLKKGENVLMLINRRGASLFLSAKV